MSTAGDAIDEVEESSIAMADLRSIAECMIFAGYAKECLSIYKIIRKSIVDEGIYRLGVEKLNSLQINKMNWEVLELPIFLSSHLPAFYASANLLYFSDLSPSLEKHEKDSNFAGYSDRNFTNYGTDWLGGTDSFQQYSGDENIPVDLFHRYNRDSTG